MNVFAGSPPPWPSEEEFTMPSVVMCSSRAMIRIRKPPATGEAGRFRRKERDYCREAFARWTPFAKAEEAAPFLRPARAGLSEFRLSRQALRRAGPPGRLLLHRLSI